MRHDKPRHSHHIAQNHTNTPNNQLRKKKKKGQNRRFDHSSVVSHENHITSSRFMQKVVIRNLKEVIHRTSLRRYSAGTGGTGGIFSSFSRFMLRKCLFCSAAELFMFAP